MRIRQVLPVVPVRDVEAAAEWYAKLLGRPADARPMPSLAEWTINETVTVQVFHNAGSAGHGELNLAVDSVYDADRTLRERGIVPGEISEVSAFVRILPVIDPDGNALALLEAR